MLPQTLHCHVSCTIGGGSMKLGCHWFSLTRQVRIGYLQQKGWLLGQGHPNG